MKNTVAAIRHAQQSRYFSLKIQYRYLFGVEKKTETRNFMIEFRRDLTTFTVARVRMLRTYIIYVYVYTKVSRILFYRG